MEGQGWVTASTLQQGQRVKTLDGDTATVVNVTLEPGETPVYNFEVDADHTYFVSAEQVLVHNNCGNFIKNYGKGNVFRGGKKKVRDYWGKYANEKDFQNWWHRRGKKEWGGNDIEREMLDNVFNDWLQQGKPKVK